MSIVDVDALLAETRAAEAAIGAALTGGPIATSVLRDELVAIGHSERIVALAFWRLAEHGTITVTSGRAHLNGPAGQLAA